MPATFDLELVRRIFHEGTSAPNPPAVIAEIFAPDFVCHGPPGVNHSHAGGAAGPELCMFQGAFESMAFTVEEIGTDGDKVTCRVRATGRQTGEFQGVRPSGREMSFRASTTFLVRDGKVAEGWGVLIPD